MQRTLILCTLLVTLLCGAAKNPTRTEKPKETTLQAPQSQIWVGKSDEAQSCGVNSGITTDKMGAELLQAGIKFTEKKKLPDDKLHIQMCGIDKGTMNVFLISKQDLGKAQSLGFSEVLQK